MLMQHFKESQKLISLKCSPVSAPHSIFATVVDNKSATALALSQEHLTVFKNNIQRCRLLKHVSSV